MPSTSFDLDAGRSTYGYLIPENRASERWITAALFIATGFFLHLFCSYTNFNGDEGIILQGAQRIVDGQVLYRDFFAFYTPGSYYFTALLFKVFGSSILVARYGLVVSGALFSVLLYLLARRICSRWSALLAVYTATLTCLPFRFLVTHWDSTLFAYLTLYFAVCWIERENWIWALGTGILGAVTCLFEQAKGFGIVVGLIAGISVITMRTGSSIRPFRLRMILIAAAGLVSPLIITLSYFATMRSLPAMLRDCAWPLFHYSVTNKTPYGYVVASSNGANLWANGWGLRIILLIFAGPFLLIPLLPFVAAGVFLRCAFMPCPQQFGSKWRYWVLIAAVLSGLLVSTLLTKRPDFTHLDYLAPLFYLALAWVIDGFPINSQLWRRLLPVVAFYIFVSSTVFTLAMLAPPLSAHQRITTPRGTVRTDDRDQSFQYVLSHVLPGEKIFIYPYEPLYYYLTGTVSPTRFDFLQVGMHTPDQFKESLRELQRDQPRIVLFETSTEEKLLWTSPATPIGLLAANDPLQSYILTHYIPCGGAMENQYWRFLLMIRRDLPCERS